MNRTEAQTLASRRNGANSHGPATAAGKSRSAANATKHGLWSREVVLSTEDPEAFAAYKQRLTVTANPTTTTAFELIDQIAAATWRLDRIMKIETTLLNREIERLADEKPGLDAEQLTAAAYQSLYQDGILRHINREEARQRRLLEKLHKDLNQERLCEILEQRRTPVSAPTQRPTPMSAPTPAPVPESVETNPKRPTYDTNGRRIHYPDNSQAA